MGILKKILLLVITVELLVVLWLMGERTWVKVQDMNGYLQHITYQSRYCKPDASLVQIVEREKAIQRLLDGMVENEWMEFQASSYEPFVYKAYQKNRYLPLVWKPEKKASPLVDELESKAKHLLGRRYVWGAVGPKCFDCSGFTMKVFREIGINLPRVSRNQAKVGQKVSFDELKAGDMVFFGTDRHQAGRVNHVGIYLEDGKFIHASSGSRRVVITSFDQKKFYRDRFLWGRRVVQESMHYAFESLPNMKTAMLSASLSSFKNPISLP